MQVVEDEHDRPQMARSLQERCHGLEETETCSLGLGRDEARELGEEFPQLGYQMCDLGSPSTELGAKLRRIAQTDARPQRLHPRPVDGRSARLPAAAYENVCTVGLRMARQLLCEATLADAGLPDEEEDPTVSVVHFGESVYERFELALPADESPSRGLGRL